MTGATASAGSFPIVRDVGLCGMLVTFSGRLSDEANVATIAFRAAVEAGGIEGVLETSMSLVSVFVGYDPLRLPRATLRARLALLLGTQDWAAAALPVGRHRWRIPAAFGGANGPQLAEAAELAGVPVRQAVADITGKPLRVMTIGFAPGQPYLGTLPRHWDIPRQAALTAKVPAGSIVVAIRQLVLFTRDSPTGWRLIGQTAFQNFRPHSAVPFALNPGDEVVFVPVEAAALAGIAADGCGNGGAEREAIA